ncbi:hypothetical protein [Leucobacter sp. UCMA 4100]|uniref:hypothetical protein n=1 Tax=Leucobacter sp. UCMA 4100 TaxID=2810534 RepID=UPI002FDBF363
MILSMLGDPEATVQCSRAGCTLPAQTRIMWRNPKIHDETRTKVWLACADHEDYLAEFLRARNFPVSTEPFTGA